MRGAYDRMSAKPPLDSLFSIKNSGGMRVFLFAKFYEDILRKYLTHIGYKVFPGKPRIFWNNISIPQGEVKEDHERLVSTLRRVQSSNVYCMPDGLLERGGRYFVWEAKNWVQELFYSPFAQRIWDFPWLLAKQVDYQGQAYLISGFLISWWDREEDWDKALAEAREIISPLSLDVIFTKDVLRECIVAQYEWYLQLVKERQQNSSEFFDILLGGK